MARKKLSEFKAKNILLGAIGQEYQGIELDGSSDDWKKQTAELTESNKYVLKVDQAEKGRFKKGLVKLDLDKSDINSQAQELFDKGYRFLLVEPFKAHEAGNEWYFSVERTREGNKVSFSKSGGVDVENNADDMTTFLYDDSDIKDLDLPEGVLGRIIKAFDDNYFGFLEINPLVVADGKANLLDAAVEVDAEGDFFEDLWDEHDLRSPLSRQLTQEEEAVKRLASKSQASFSLEVINPDGGIFLLLSGGGASVVVADEVFNLGHGQELGNYGEYSGNPNLEETRLYTEQIAKLLLNSKASKKVLIIGGGVANFTDVRVTFKGVIEALQAYEKELKAQGVKVFVRRGGPHEKEGLAAMKAYLEKAGLYGHVAGPELILAGIVGIAIEKGGF